MKQHELLAFESDVKNRCINSLNEARELMKHSERFIEERKVYTAFDENDKDIPESSYKAMTTTVNQKMKYVQKYISAYLDNIIQKETTNQKAKADITIKDEFGAIEKVIAKDVPVAALLQYEKALCLIRDSLYRTIPTIDTNYAWSKGENELGDVYIQESTETTRTVADIEYKTIDVGDKFPKQVQEVKVTKPVGKYVKTIKSGALSPKEKSEMLTRIDRLIEAVKIARSTANNAEVEIINCGNDIMKYINNG